MPLGSTNHTATTTGPRPTHGGYPPPALHQPVNHPQKKTVHTLALSKEEGEGFKREGGARPPPQLLPATHPPVLKPLNLDSSLCSISLPDTKTTLPLLIIGDCRLRLVQQHPLSLPTRGFRNNGGLDLSGLGVLALPPPDPPYVAMHLDCGKQPPHTWHDDLCAVRIFETLFQRRVDGLKPASTCLGLSPGHRPFFGGALGWPNYGPNWLGRSIYGPYPPFLVHAARVSPCRCEPLRAGCCVWWRGGFRCFVGVN